MVDTEWIKERLFQSNVEELTIKLLIIPVDPSVFFAYLSKWTSASSFGYLHTGIQINGTVVDWNTTGLIVPRLFSSNVHAALDIHSAATHKLKKTPELVETVAALIAKWNNDYEYASLTRNCQHFVTELIKAIGSDFSWNESIESYLNEIKNNPKNVTPHINYQLNGKLVRKNFKTHQELDDFITELSNSDPHQYSKLRGLLKAFDRGFWFRECSKENFEIPTKCPFNLPTGYELQFKKEEVEELKNEIQ